MGNKQNVPLVSPKDVFNKWDMCVPMTSKKAEANLTNDLDYSTQYKLSVDAPLVKE